MAPRQKKTKKIDEKSSLYLRILHREFHMNKSKISKRFGQFAKRSVYRHASKPLETEVHRGDTVGPKKKRGRPRKLTERDERAIVNALKKSRKELAGFTAKQIQDSCNLGHVSTKCVHRVLHKNGYHYLQSRKKGLVFEKDKVRRLKFAREAKKFPKGFWINHIKFYFDGVGFAHKTNPNGEARSTANMAWRKRKEGLSRSTKGKKEGSGGKMANFFVAISHGHGTVLCKQYTWKVNGKNFADFVLRCFPEAFQKLGVSPAGSMFLQDGDPRQNSRVARNAFETLGFEMFSIPPRSPDLNPIENVFHLVRKKLKQDAIDNNITHETYQEFSKRVAQTITDFSPALITKTIESMEKRIEMVVNQKGERIKY